MRNKNLSHQVLSSQESDIVSIQSTRFANTCIFGGTESFATITSIWTIERSISPHTCRRFTDRTTPIGRRWRFYQPFERHRDTLDRCPSEKCRWDGETDFRYCASYFSPFLLIPRARSRASGRTLPRQIRGEAPLHSWISSTLRERGDDYRFVLEGLPLLPACLVDENSWIRR